MTVFVGLTWRLYYVEVNEVTVFAGPHHGGFVAVKYGVSHVRPRGGPLALDGVSAPRPPKPGSRGAHDGAHDGARQVKRLRGRKRRSLM